MSDITKQDLDNLEERLSKKIDSQGVELRKEIKESGNQLRKEIKESGNQLRKEIKESGDQLRKEIKESADTVLEVISSLATSSSNQFIQIDQKLEDLRADLTIIKRQINNINADIDRAFKNKTVTEEETTALIAGQRRLERWVEQIASETGIKLTA
jgi:gas vesicle protein